MTHNIATPRPWWFWIIVIAFLIWNIIGCGMYLAERLMEDAAYAEAFGPSMVAVREITPIWATAGYALGVWSGLAGMFALIMRKRVAVTLFTVSLLGAVIGFLPYIIDGRFKAVLTGGDYGFMIFIFAECLFILWFARRMLRPATTTQAGTHFD